MPTRERRRKKVESRNASDVVEWSVGQPLSFPPKKTERNILARKIMEAAIRQPVKRTRRSRSANRVKK